jgi:hypothetical protein
MRQGNTGIITRIEKISKIKNVTISRFNNGNSIKTGSTKGGSSNTAGNSGLNRIIGNANADQLFKKHAKEIIKKVQQVRSQEVELIQLADLLTGAVSYVNRGLTDSKAKNILIEHIRHRSKYTLTKSTLIREQKFNIFLWESSKYGYSI